MVETSSVDCPDTVANISREITGTGKLPLQVVEAGELILNLVKLLINPLPLAIDCGEQNLVTLWPIEEGLNVLEGKAQLAIGEDALEPLIVILTIAALVANASLGMEQAALVIVLNGTDGDVATGCQLTTGVHDNHFLRQLG